MMSYTANYISRNAQKQSGVLMGLIKSGNIKRHTMLNDNDVFARKIPVYLTRYSQFLKSRNFALLLECEGSEIYD